jgi:tight adherence protein C
MKDAPNIPPQNSSPPPVRRTGRLTDRLLPPEERAESRTSFMNRVVVPYLEQLANPGQTLTRNINYDEIRVRLLRAGFPMGLTAQRFVIVKWTGLLVGVLLFLAYFPVLNIVLDILAGVAIPAWYLPFFLVLGALYGFRLPDIWLSIQIRKRQREIQLLLPDMMDLISISVEAGLGLNMAIQRISDRFPNVLSEEFQRTLQEVQLGRSQSDAMRDMARRVDVPDLTTLLTAIVQADLLGLAVSNVLRVQSERLRERRSQRARESAQKAPIKMTFPLALFIFPALFMVILGPVMIAIFTSNSI